MGFQAVSIPLILLIGYFYAESNYLHNYKLKVLNGQKLYYYVAKYGVVFFGLGLLSYFILLTVIEHVRCLNWIIDIGRSINFQINKVLGSDNLPLLHWLSILSFSWISAILALQYKNSKTPKLDAFYEAIQDQDLELLIYKSIDSQKTVAVTLDNGKVYVGWVLRAYEPNEKSDHIRILPILSGYRTIEQLKIEFTTDYYDMYISLYGGEVLAEFIDDDGEVDDDDVFDKQDEIIKDAASLDFDLLVPVKDIKTISLFDTELYLEFEENTENDDGEQL